MIIDDDPAISRLVRLILRTEEIAVELADSGPAGLDLLRNGSPRPDVILLDLAMPGMDGREVFQLARRSGVRCPIRFLLRARRAGC